MSLYIIYKRSITLRCRYYQNKTKQTSHFNRHVSLLQESLFSKRKNVAIQTNETEHQEMKTSGVEFQIELSKDLYFILRDILYYMAGRLNFYRVNWHK